MHIYNYVVKSPVFSYLFFMHFSPFSFSLLLFVATVEWLGEGAREDTDRQTDRQEQKSDYWIFPPGELSEHGRRLCFRGQETDFTESIFAIIEYT